MSASSSLPLRVLTLPNASKVQVTLGKLSNSSYVLYMAISPPIGTCESPMWSIISSLVSEDPFPGYSSEGNEMIWLKNYSENEGMLDILESAGWVRSAGRTIQQGFVSYPLVEIRLKESEMSHTCPGCTRHERVGDERYMRCAKCKKTYYCSKECQVKNWNQHKVDCKDLKEGNRVAIENRNRFDMGASLAAQGFKFASVPI